MHFLLLLLVPFFLLADTGLNPDRSKPPGTPKGPWLTGPLLTTSAYTVAKGHFNFEPYVFLTNDLGFFSARGHLHRTTESPKAINSVELLQLGLTENVDINIYPQFTYNYGTGKDKIGMGDLVISPTFQIWRDDPRYHNTTFKVGLSQVFPCGKFENLDPDFSGNDGLGSGGWSTKVFIAASKTFHLRKENFIEARGSFSTIFYSPLNVHGHNYYGGDVTTIGSLSRGISIILDLAMELTLSLHWAIALDVETVYTTGSTFNGITIDPVGNPLSSTLVSFAPALEYNFTKNVGIIAGVWFVGYGSNIEDFVNGVIALNIFI